MPPNESNMADSRHCEKSKNLNIFATNWPILTKFGMRRRLDPLDPNNQLNFAISKIQYGGGVYLENSKNRNILNGTTDFDDIWYSYASEPSRHRQPIKFHKFKNPRWRQPPSWKIEKSSYLRNRFDPFWRNLAHWCVSTLSTPIANKISLF